MITHAPLGYRCPFCRVVQGIEDEHVLTRQTDLVVRTDDVTAFICSHQFATTPGHTLVIPNAHYEQLYNLPTRLLHQVHDVVQTIARPMKRAYGCDGIIVWQSNEPAGTQTVWHYHVHVIPRFANDAYFAHLADLDRTYSVMAPERRAAYAERLAAAMRDDNIGDEAVQ